jgi:hypothetical protein
MYIKCAGGGVEGERQERVDLAPRLGHQHVSAGAEVCCFALHVDVVEVVAGGGVEQLVRERDVAKLPARTG